MKNSKINKTDLVIGIGFIAIPLITGLLNYLILAPETMVTQLFGKLFGIDIAFTPHNTILIYIRYYLSDICWAVALVNSLLLILGNTKKNAWIPLIVASVFCVIVESFQLFGFIKGTFDFFDILIELVATVTSWLISTKIRFKK